MARIVEGEAEAGGTALVGRLGDEGAHLRVPARSRARIGVEEEQPRARRRLRPGRKLPAPPGLRLHHPRTVAAGVVSGAVLRAAVGDHHLGRYPRAPPAARGHARHTVERRAEHAGGLEGRNHDADVSGGTGRTMAARRPTVNPTVSWLGNNMVWNLKGGRAAGPERATARRAEWRVAKRAERAPGA